MRMEVVPVVGDNVIWSHQAQKYQGRVADRTLDYAGFDEKATIVIDNSYKIRKEKQGMSGKKKQVRLKVTYPSKYFDSNYDSKIEALVGTGSDGSGMGPDGRDMDFTLTASQYEKAVKALEDSGLKGIVTSAENAE